MSLLGGLPTFVNPWRTARSRRERPFPWWRTNRGDRPFPDLHPHDGRRRLVGRSPV